VLARFLQTPTVASSEAIVPTPAAASCLCHVSDHADAIDGIAFASRGVDASAFATASERRV